MQTDTEVGVIREINQWFFEHYLLTWQSIGNSESRNPKEILDYWNVPMHAASRHMNKWLLTEKAVLGRLGADHKRLRSAEYTHTNGVDRRTVVYHNNAASGDVIWSRCRHDNTEIERLAAHFEINRTGNGWRIIGFASAPTAKRLIAGDLARVINAPTRAVGRPRRAGTKSEENEGMKFISFRHHGEPADVLTVDERPVPELGEEEARVRILATPVNPSDLLYVRGNYSGVQAQFPAPVGFEGVGIVDAVGPRVRGLAPGQRVSVVNSQGGNWAEYAVVPASDLIPVSDEIPDEQVASFVINPASAILMVRRVLAVPPGEWLLQSAAGSELGRMIIRLAKHDGIRTLNIVRRRESVAALQYLGADAVIVSTDGPIDEQVRKIVGPEGVKYAIDPVVGETGTQMFKALHEEGRMLAYGSLTGDPIRVGEDPRYILSGRRVLEVYWLGYWLHRLDETARNQLAEDIATLLRNGILQTCPGQTYSLGEIVAAVCQAESTGRQGKVLLVPGKQQ